MIHTDIKDCSLTFQTTGDLFSPHDVDAGTLAMLSNVDFSPDDYVLDLGCGYGVVGILVAKLLGSGRVVMVDVDPAAVSVSKENAVLNGVPDVKIYRSDGFRDFGETGFTVILSNPPYHADFAVPKHFIEKGFNRLAVGGKMLLVTKRKEWYKNKMIAIFGGVRIWEANGYYVFMSVKKSMAYAIKPKR